jgi:hypothetical protein
VPAGSFGLVFPDTEAVMELRLVVTIDTASGQEEWEVKLCKLR